MSGPDRGAVRRRAEDAVRTLSPSFPGNPGTGLLGGDEAAEERFAASHTSEPSPALRCRAIADPEGGEDTLLDERERRLDRRGETIVAFSLAGRRPAA